MSRQHPPDAVSVPSSPRSSTLSAITIFRSADDDCQHLEAFSGLDTRPGQPYALSETSSEIEMHTMVHTPREIAISTSNDGDGKTTPKERESLVDSVQQYSNRRGGWRRNC